MIARDNERTIGAALETIRKYVDDIVVVDTGSKDRTPEIAASLGARVFHFPWIDDFSAARNESIRHALGQWILWMDTDDSVDEENARMIRQLVEAASDPSPYPLPKGERGSSFGRVVVPRAGGASPEVMGFLMQVRDPVSNENGDTEFIAVDQVKLLRNLPRLRFEFRIHEQILLSIRRAGGTVAWTDIFVTHSGSDKSAEAQARKLERDLRILDLDYREHPDHPFVLFNLGMTLEQAGRAQEAVNFLWQSIGRSGSDDSHLRKAYALLVACYRNLGRHATALETCQQGIQRFPDDAELRFRLGVMLHSSGRLAEAAEAFETLLGMPESRHLSSVDRGIKGYRARQCLAGVWMEMGRYAEAETLFRQVIAEVPRHAAGWRELGDALLRQQKHREALELAEQMRTEPMSPSLTRRVSMGNDCDRVEPMSPSLTLRVSMGPDEELARDGHMLRVEALVAAGDPVAARGELESAMSQNCTDVAICERYCRLLFEHFTPAEAEPAFRRLVELDPQNGASYHNLGSVLYKLGRYDAATDAYRKSLQVRPDSASTYLHLGYALRESNLPADAAAAWRRTLELAPGDPNALEALRQAGPAT